MWEFAVFYGLVGLLALVAACLRYLLMTGTYYVNFESTRSVLFEFRPKS